MASGETEIYCGVCNRLVAIYTLTKPVKIMCDHCGYRELKERTIDFHDHDFDQEEE